MDFLEITQAMLVIQEAGGLMPGGINFDAKLRRNSIEESDLFIAHINGMDTFARSLIAAEKVLNSSPYKAMRKERYSSFDSGDGARFEAHGLTLEKLSDIAIQNGEPVPKSGRQERYEMLINKYI
jgi:xylose isomerase